MQVVIFCGGLGTRIRGLNDDVPKPMIEIGGKPVLWHIMKHYAHYGHKDFILCLGYKQEVIRNYFTANLDLPKDWTIELVNTGLDTKKGARLKKIEPLLKEKNFLLTYGDGVGDVDIQASIQQHLASKKLVTFTGVKPVSRFATAEFDDKGEIIDWNEKKTLESRINAGFFVIEKSALSFIRGDVEFEEAPMKELARARQVSMYAHDGFWHCMDTYRDWAYLNSLDTDGKAPWRVWKD